MSQLSGSKRAREYSGDNSAGSKYARDAMSGSGYRRLRRRFRSTFKRSSKRRFTGRGGMNIVRMAAPFYIAPSSVLGTPQIIGNTTGITFGGAIASGGIIPGIYDVPFAKFSQANECINSADFSALFDLYRIRKVQWIITITCDASTYAGGAGTAVSSASMITQPTLFWYADIDDAQVPTTSSLRERMGVKMKQLTIGKPVKISWAPRAEALSYNASGTVVGAAVGSRSTWFDTSNMAVPHFALKAMLANLDLRTTTGSNPGYQITVEQKMYLNLKDAR